MNQFRALVPLMALLAILSSCRAPQDTKAAASNEIRSAPQPGLFTVPREQLAHLRIVPVATSNWAIAIHTTGTVDFDADHTTQAITQVNGPISRILVDTGVRVKAGEPLLYVSSPDVANAISTYRKARNQEQLAQLTLNRTQVLLERGAVAQKDLEAAQAAFNDSATDVQNSLQALRIFGVTKQEIDQAEHQNVAISTELAVFAPIAGIVVQKLVSPGQLIQAGATTCFMISDVSTVWVQGHIFDHDLPSVRLGDTVEESNPAFAQKFHGVLSYIGSMADAATRTTPVRIVTENPAGLLKKDSFIDAVIHTRTQKNVLTVPVSAVLHDEQNEPFVYVEIQPGKFAQRLITVGAQQSDQQEIVGGLKHGDKVVSEGSVFLQFANSYQ
jgi:cobalt-zinc-cadmium efflux system membrane fusion protein